MTQVSDNPSKSHADEWAGRGQTNSSLKLGQLIVASVPIGDPADASSRLRDVLRQADVIACEDSRKLKRLLGDLEVSTSAKFESYHDAIEKSKSKRLLEYLIDGASVVLVTDAGTPLVSDPGYELVRQALSAQISVSVAPGPSAAIAALIVSGLAPDRFVFEGFLPKKSGARNTRLAELATDPRTIIIYEPARNVTRTLKEMVAPFGGERRVCVARELTKIHEEVLRGTVEELIAEVSGRDLKGEVTLVIEGLTRKGQRQNQKLKI